MHKNITKSLVVFSLAIVAFSAILLFLSYGLSTSSFPLHSGFKEQCYDNGYLMGLGEADPRCNATSGLSFFVLSAVSVAYIALVSLVGAILGFDRKKNFIASLAATLV
jgi:uncharacterized membrane protein